MKREGKLQGFESKALKKIFGREQEEVAGDLGRLHSELLLELGSSLNITIMNFIFFLIVRFRIILVSDKLD